MSFLDGLKIGIDRIFGDYGELTDDFFDELTELLILSDAGWETTEKIVSSLRKRIYDEGIHTRAQARAALIDTIGEELRPSPDAYDFMRERSVILLVGVNGVGKTTTAGKLSYRFYMAGKSTVLAAADTWRAGATEQLGIWAERSHAFFVGGREGGDPASVIYEACDKYLSLHADYLLADTAGRVHNKKNLMEELAKIKRILDRKLPDIHREVLLVLDATTGQNALSQLREFICATDVSGIVLTKLDGTAKGGVVISLNSLYHVPVKFIGVGEGIDELKLFEPEAFLRDIFTPPQST